MTETTSSPKAEASSSASKVPAVPASWLFRCTAIAAALFIVTILALVAQVFGTTQSPAARWLNRHASGLIGVEVAAVLILGVAAMADDRRRTLRSMSCQPQPKPTKATLTTTDEPR